MHRSSYTITSIRLSDLLVEIVYSGHIVVGDSKPFSSDIAQNLGTVIDQHL